jgi:hypothetical protein
VIVLIDSIRRWTNGRKQPEMTTGSSLAEASTI